MRLRVWLPPLAELRADSRMGFEVLDARRRVLNRGEALISALPKAMDSELVLDAFDVLLLDTKLPKLSGAKLAKALRALVEEQVVGDIERNHVVATPRDAEGRATVAVVDRALLKRALDIFERAGRRVVQATPQPLALNIPPGGWRVRWRDGRGCVRTGQTSGMGIGPGEASPVELRLLLSQSIQRPAYIEVDGDCDVQAWGKALHIDVKPGRVSELAPPLVLDLLQYEFAPGIFRWQTWRTTVALGIVLLVTAIGGLNLHAWALRAQERALRDTMVAIVKESFPQIPVVLDPVAQMRRLASDLRAGAGTGRDGFVVMAVALGEVAESDSVQSVEYRDGRTTVRFQPQKVQADSQRAALSERAASIGISLRFAGDVATLEPRSAP